MTLVEMTVVLAIIAIVLGIGAGMFAASRRDAFLRTAEGDLAAKLRFARAQAVVRRAPARVRWDGRTRRLDVLLDRTFALWHAEDLVTTGAFGFDGRVAAATLQPGKIGYAFEFTGAGSVRVDRLALPTGLDSLSVEAWVYPATADTPRTIFDKKGELGVRVDGDGTFGAYFGQARVQMGPTAPRLAPEQWSHVRLAAEDGRVTLYLNGAAIGDAPLTKLPPAGASPFVIGAGGANGDREGFSGLIDEIAVRGRAVEESSEVHEQIVVAATGALPDPRAKGMWWIVLTDQGRLDPGAHAGPVTVTLTRDEAKKTVKVGWLGNLEP